MKNQIRLITFFCGLLFSCCSFSASMDQLSQCEDCHAKQSKSVNNQETLACAHAKKGLSQCIACHDSVFLEKSHEKVQAGEKKFVAAKKYGPEQCLKCHGTQEALAARTAESTALKDSKGKTINPHQLPATENHQNIACAQCHKVHKKQPIVNRNCYGCHHTKEFSCSGCHDQKQ